MQSKKLKILSNREKEAVLKGPCAEFGIDALEFAECVLLEGRDEVWISNRDCLASELRDIPVESVGLLFARKKRGIQLTVNAVQLFFNNATKNVITIRREEAPGFIHGVSLPVATRDGSYIIKCGKSALDVGVVRASVLVRKTKA
jgi:NOL1/NOP2/fmu family ribosome biogenesis protein